MIQYREAKERAQRQASAPAPLPRPILSDFVDVSSIPSDEILISALNGYFQKYTKDHKLIKEEFLLPLSWFDSSLFAEKAHSLQAGERVVYLSEDKTSLGNWMIGNFIASEDEAVKLQSTDSAIITVNTLVFSFQDDFSELCDRLKSALTLRHQVVGLLHYHHVVSSIPYDSSVISDIRSNQLDRIKAKASTLPLEQSSPIVLGQELECTQYDFRTIMNRIIFNARLRSSKLPLFTPIDFMKELPWLFQSSSKAPKLGYISIPKHNMKSVIQNFEKSSFLCSAAALKALRGTVEESYHIQQLVVLPLSYKHSQTLQSFERTLGDTLTSAIRAIKQEWPQRTASAIRKALLNDPRKTYDLNIRNVHDFEVR